MSLRSPSGIAFMLVSCLLAAPSARAEAPSRPPSAVARVLPESGALAARIDRALAPTTALQAAALELPESREALAQELTSAGIGLDEQPKLLDAILEAARQAAAGGAWTEPLVAIGPFTLSVAQLRSIAGPREGRDRFEVAQRLRLATSSQGQSTDEELLALVPELVDKDEEARADAVLLRLDHALVQEDDQ